MLFDGVPGCWGNDEQPEGGASPADLDGLIAAVGDQIRETRRRYFAAGLVGSAEAERFRLELRDLEHTLLGFEVARREQRTGYR